MTQQASHEADDVPAPGEIRFGLIGTGIAATTHARELAHVAGARLWSVFARDPGKGERFAVDHGAQAFTDLDAFLCDPALHAVIVATPNGLHRDYAIAAAAAGKHVVVEKPLEITLPRARDIVAACEQAGVRLFVIYQMRESLAARKARDDIAAGRLGRIILVNVIDNEYRTPAYYAADAWRGTRNIEGGGCLITQSSHLLDLVQHLVGPVASVFARTATALHDIETEDVAVATLCFVNGALGVLSSSTAAYPAHRHLVTIVGTEGSIIFNGERDEVVLRASRQDAEVLAPPSDFTFADHVDPRAFPTQRQRRQLQGITDRLAAGRAGEADDPLQAVRFLDALYRSAREGCEIPVEAT